MLFNPDTMPEYAKRKPKGHAGILSKGKVDKRSHWQNEKSKHKQPSTYVDTKVEKRKS